jgi:hypothetical protein
MMETSRAWARVAASGELERILSFWSGDASDLTADDREDPAAIEQAGRPELALQPFALPVPGRASAQEDGAASTRRG